MSGKGSLFSYRIIIHIGPAVIMLIGPSHRATPYHTIPEGTNLYITRRGRLSHMRAHLALKQTIPFCISHFVRMTEIRVNSPSMEDEEVQQLISPGLTSNSTSIQLQGREKWKSHCSGFSCSIIIAHEN